MLTLDQIKAAHGPKFFTLHVTAWGGDVLVRRLSAQKYIELNSRSEEGKANPFEYFASLAEWSLVNEDGSPLITDDSRYLLTDNPLLVTEIGKAILDLNKLGGLEKKDSGQSESSPTESA